MSQQNERTQLFPYFWYPVVLGFAGGLLLVLVAGLTVWSVAGAIFLCTAALFAGRHLVRLQAHFVVAPQPVSGLRDLCLRALPLWARQIDSSRRTGDEAALNLVRIFDVAVSELETALSASRGAVAEISGKDGGTLAAINASEADLRHVVEILRTVQRSKSDILADITRFTIDLKEMVKEVQHIALQVRMLSFNAAIEAAHAGKAGIGFTVVAAEMRQLADSSAKMSGGMAKRIEKIEAIDATLTNIFQDRKSADADELSVIKADTAIRDVMARFKQLTTSLSHAVEIMEKEGDLVHKKIFDALEALQYQDRVSQILEHVVSGLNDLCRLAEEHANIDLDAAAWMHEMAREFSTAEEFDNLRGALGHGASGRKPEVRDTTFF